MYARITTVGVWAALLIFAVAACDGPSPTPTAVATLATEVSTPVLPPEPTAVAAEPTAAAAGVRAGADDRYTAVHAGERHYG